jgi:polyisoprenoid-binding protein YceI
MQKALLNTVFTVSILALAACSNPADNVSEAKVNEPKPSEAEVAKPAEGTDVKPGTPYVIGGDSKIDFLASKAVGGETPGGFKKFAGQLLVIDGKLDTSASKIVIDMDSIWTNSEKLTAHLKNGDFFNVPEIPTTTFAATGLEEVEGKQTLTGDLTMHGVTKSISFPVELAITDELVTLKAEFFVNRFDFEMKYPGKADNLIRKEVVIKLDVTATAGEEATGA